MVGLVFVNLIMEELDGLQTTVVFFNLNGLRAMVGRFMDDGFPCLLRCLLCFGRQDYNGTFIFGFKVGAGAGLFAGQLDAHHLRQWVLVIDFHHCDVLPDWSDHTPSLCCLF